MGYDGKYYARDYYPRSGDSCASGDVVPFAGSAQGASCGCAPSDDGGGCPACPGGAVGGLPMAGSSVNYCGGQPTFVGLLICPAAPSG